MNDPQSTRLYRARLVATHVCSACGGALRELYGTVGCVYLCRPAGYVARSAVEQARHDALTAEDEARLAQPDRERPAGDAVAKVTLWGDDQ